MSTTKHELDTNKTDISRKSTNPRKLQIYLLPQWNGLFKVFFQMRFTVDVNSAIRSIH